MNGELGYKLVGFLTPLTKIENKPTV